MKEAASTNFSPRGRPRTFNRSQALLKALELFWRRGYAQTTVSQLCSAMNIRSPSLYCAFGSKSQLFLEALAYYRHTYWDPLFRRFMEEKNIYRATKKLLEQTAQTLLLPEAPCGCLTVVSALTLPAEEEAVLQAVASMRQETKKIFRQRLMAALKEHQLPADCDVPAVAGALTNFFEGLALQARDEELCLAELTAIAVQGVHLLPKRQQGNASPCESGAI